MPGSFLGFLSPNDVQPGEQMIDGTTINSLVRENNASTGSLTALAGGGLVGSPLLTTYINEFTTCASANDSCQLPAAVAGIRRVVVNSGAQNLRIYCQTSNPNNLTAAGVAQADTIIPLAGGTATYYTLAANGLVEFYCTALGRWKADT